MADINTTPQSIKTRTSQPGQHSWKGQKPGEVIWQALSLNKDGTISQHLVHPSLKDIFIANNQSKWNSHIEITWESHLKGKDIHKYYQDVNGQLAYDKDYTTILMGLGTIRNKHRARLQAKIDTEMESQTPNTSNVIMWQHALTKLKSWTPLQLYTQALTNLNESVATGQPDKPSVRQLLINKI